MCMFIVSHAAVCFSMFLVGYPQTPEPVISLVDCIGTNWPIFCWRAVKHQSIMKHGPSQKSWVEDWVFEMCCLRHRPILFESKDETESETKTSVLSVLRYRKLENIQLKTLVIMFTRWVMLWETSRAENDKRSWVMVCCWIRIRQYW